MSEKLFGFGVSSDTARTCVALVERHAALMARRSVGNLSREGKLVKRRMITEAERARIWRLHLAGKINQEIAAIVGRSESVVSRWIRRARQKQAALKAAA